MITPVPISTLGDATLPLQGDELLPVVQNSITRKVTVADIAGVASGEAAATLVAGQNDDLAVADIAVAARVALTLVADATLTGVAGGTDGMRRMFVNRSAVFMVIFMSDVSSAAANRFVSNGDIIVPPLCGAEYIYDGTNQRWVKT